MLCCPLLSILPSAVFNQPMDSGYLCKQVSTYSVIRFNETLYLIDILHAFLLDCYSVLPGFLWLSTYVLGNFRFAIFWPLSISRQYVSSKLLSYGEKYFLYLLFCGHISHPVSGVLEVKSDTHLLLYQILLLLELICLKYYMMNNWLCIIMDIIVYYGCDVCSHYYIVIIVMLLLMMCDVVMCVSLCSVLRMSWY